MRGMVEGVVWPVDLDGGVAWRLRWHTGVIDDDATFASEVMDAYARLVDPSTTDEEAVHFLEQARLVAGEAMAGYEQEMLGRLATEFVVIVGDRINGPYTLTEAQARAASTGGVVRRMQEQ